MEAGGERVADEVADRSGKARLSSPLQGVFRPFAVRRGLFRIDVSFFIHSVGRKVYNRKLGINMV